LLCLIQQLTENTLVVRSRGKEGGKMWKRRIVLLIGCFVLVNPRLLYAGPNSNFEGERQGLVVGINFGCGKLWATRKSIKPSLRNVQVISQENSLSSSFDFKIGYAPTNVFVIYAGYQTRDWMSRIFVNRGRSVIKADIVSMGVIYFYAPEAPSLFFAGEFGFLRDRVLPLLPKSSPALWGWNGSFGLGYEFLPHWIVQVEFLLGTVKESVRWQQEESSWIELHSTLLYGVVVSMPFLGY